MILSKSVMTVSLFLLVSGCVSKNPIIDPSYMGSSALNNVSYEQIQKQLSRFDAKSSMGLATNEIIYAKVTPITAPLIIAQENENGKKQLRSDVETKKVIDQNIKNLVSDRSCFWVMVQTSGNIQAADFKNWVGKVKTNSGELIEVEFSNTDGISSVPKPRIGAWDHNVYQWENFTGACAKSKFNKTQNFSVILSNTMMKKVENIELKWSFNK